MGYEWMGRVHAALVRATSETRGQGTVEYVGLVLLMAVVLAGLVKAAGSFSDDKGIPGEIVDKLKQAIQDTGGRK